MNHKNLRILQYNCGQANYGATRPVLDGAAPAQHTVLAIQEPAYNRLTKTTYCPKGYTLAAHNSPSTRVCFMVSKLMPIQDWRFEHLSDQVAALHIRTTCGELVIINVYNPRGTAQRIATWDTIAGALREGRETILLGDFNAHHPVWGGYQAASEPQSHHLLRECAARDLSLVTPRGIPTWKRGRQESVIDLTFVSHSLVDAVSYYGPEDS